MLPLNTKTNVALTMDGLVMAFTDEKNETCSLGILRDAPAGHDMSITISRLNPPEDPELLQTIHQAGIENHLEITVSNTSKSGITRRGMDLKIDRLHPVTENQDSFLWVVDFENEIYHEPIGAKKEGFASLLTINHGELLTRNRSKNMLTIKRGLDGAEEVFGFVATKFGIDIVLDRPDSLAVFKNGDRVIFVADAQSNLLLEIKRGCSVNAGNDADSYYTAVGDNVPDEQKIFFGATEFPEGVMAPNDPDARCPNMNMTRSKPV